MPRLRLVFVPLFLFLAAPLALAKPPQNTNIPDTALDVSAPPTTRQALAQAQPVRAKHAMVVSAQHLATQVGLKILKKGGNAVDAAVAVGYALAVVHPCCGNIGGGGFMVVHLKNGKNLFLDFREKAPLAATTDMYQDKDGNVVKGRSTRTYLGVGVPGTVMGLDSALKKYGTMSLKQVIDPAIALARKGYVLKQGDINIMATHTKLFAKWPNVAAIFLHDGKPWQVGDRLKQPQLAHTLELIRDHGTKAFYHGSIARKLAAANKANGGLITMKDLADYSVKWDKPVTCGYRGYTVVSAAPPSSGGVTICQILEILKPYPLHKWGYGSVKATHYIIEAERRAFADRNTYLGDPAFVHNPIDKLLNPKHIATMRSTIQADKATPSSEIHGSLGPAEGMHTTHYSVVDAQGNAVSVTYTLNYLFGISQMAGDTGFFLNNEMDDFTSKPGVPNTFGLVQGKINQIEPGKRPLSSMSPSLVLDPHGKLFMVTGSPGGSTIISTTMESIVNVIDFGMNMQQAVDAPRLHMQWLPDMTMVEPGLLSAATQSALEAMGHKFHEIRSWGADEAILRNPKTGLLEGANDRRRPAGLAAGY
ncbi:MULTISPECIES: gamma-glutamyltransferase [Oleiagrimonas]|uniref:Glutathione hydrolase proenzyme n=1 Tax=Oleiagrimonas citrea TaxID=1665687 RepID=A0A846ZGN5_9GAMM|nr:MULTISPECIES: gamma-glutamyltransferase [Oleiagrimonas]NKZ37656.1 gamma-glutamyltransferase [Oleiagrimonas citrea]RAP56412.1 gamma-glutamyltransferase [Oleiagrimonas sp. MCCC 1A03011]